MAKFIYILPIFMLSFVANAQVDSLKGYGYKKDLLQTNPFLNDLYNIDEKTYDGSIDDISEVEKEKLILKESGYEFNDTGYIKAIENGDNQAVMRFILLGMNPDYIKRYDVSTLFVALRAKQQHTFDFLLEQGADINYVNSKSQNMLLLAISLGYKHMLIPLINSNIDTLFMDNKSWTAMHYAINEHDFESVFILLEKAPTLLIYKNQIGNTPLLLTLEKALETKDKGYIALAKMLIKHEKYFNVSNALGNSGLHLAVMLDNYDLAKHFAENGANPNTKNAKGWRPIDVAIKNNNIDIANLLRYYGAEL